MAGAPPAIDLAAEKRLIECLVQVAAEKILSSAHDVSDGGIAVSLAESAFASGSLGVDAKLDGQAEPEVALFGERGARAIVSLAAGSLARLKAIASQCGVNATEIGTVVPADFRIQYSGATVIQGDAASFQKPWSDSLQKAIELA